MLHSFSWGFSYVRHAFGQQGVKRRDAVGLENFIVIRVLIVQVAVQFGRALGLEAPLEHGHVGRVWWPNSCRQTACA